MFAGAAFLPCCPLFAYLTWVHKILLWASGAVINLFHRHVEVAGRVKFAWAAVPPCCPSCAFVGLGAWGLINELVIL